MESHESCFCTPILSSEVPCRILSSSSATQDYWPRIVILVVAQAGQSMMTRRVQASDQAKFTPYLAEDGETVFLNRVLEYVCLFMSTGQTRRSNRLSFAEFAALEGSRHGFCRRHGGKRV